MLALVAAVFFLIALILTFVGNVLGVFSAEVFVILGLLSTALYLAGVGSRSYARARR